MNRRQRRLAQSKSGAPQAHGGESHLAHDFREAVAHLQQGRLQQSEEAHRRVLAKAPRHAPSLHHLGLIAFKRNARPEAVDYIRQSLAIDPDAHQAWLNLAVILGEARRLDEAIEACRRSLTLQASAESYAVLGNLLRVAQHTADAIAAYSDSLKLKPEQPAVLVKQGELLLQSGRSADALALCHEALARDPGHADARKLELRILASTGELESVEAIIDTQSGDPVGRAHVCDDLATALRAQRRFAEATTVQRRAIALVPDRADFHFNLALALDGLGHKQEALAAYQAGLAIEPGRAVAYASVGSVLRDMEVYAGAITAFEHAITLDPSLADAHYNLAVSYKLVGRFADARAAFGRAIASAPDSLIQRFELINLRRLVCDWDGLEAEEQRCLDLLATRDTVVAPFSLVSMPSDRPRQQEAGRRFARSFAVPDALKLGGYQPVPNGDRRIRIGYLSADFFEHATAMLLVEALENADRRRFELFGYCYSPDDGSDMRRRIVRTFDRFVPVGGLSHHDAARAIHADGIDILVDLKGYTRHARTEILAYRPAPIQVNYLGYPGTMGADFVDYILADAVVAPMAHQEHYTEQIVHLPNCYQPNDRQRPIADEPVTRARFGLPDEAFVFCSFNNSYKFTAPLFDIWMRLLDQVPGAVLWLLVKSGDCRENLAREAAARSIDPARLVFADRMPIAPHLARHALADLFLDSLPCNAHTTASDALWAGLPVLTCLGDTFAGRVAASLLTAVGLPELVTDSLEAYERLALELARDPGRLATIRQQIVAGRQTSPLFDSARYTHNLERAYETMVDIMRSGDAPRPFAVTEEQPAGRAEAPPPQARIAYERCPLCETGDIAWHIEAKVTGHPLYKPQLPPTMKWRSCTGCGHVFTEGYFTPEACEIVFSSTHNNQKVGNDAEGQRRVSARIVERVARYAPGGDWLDIGVGNGSLVFTAAEWGYKAVGTDLRTENVETLRKLGFEAHCSDIEEIDAVDRFSVVSMADVLEHVPFPRRSLAAVHRVMRRGGALFVSMPNMDTIVWRAMDASGANPYWGELEHYHNFTRARLVRLLEANGFKCAEYNISERYRSCMEVVALKV